MPRRAAGEGVFWAGRGRRLACGGVLAALLALGCALLAAEPGRAAFPGKNGKIAFQIIDRDGTAEIHAINRDGTGQTNLTSSAADDYEPSWSPDGRRIAFSSNRAGNYEIYRMWAGGGSPVRLTFNTVAGDFDPSWQPLR